MDIVSLSLICLAMAIGAFLAGYLPLVIKVSAPKLRLFSSFGAGMLIGCALLVIIPEGVETLINASKINQGSIFRPNNASPNAFISNASNSSFDSVKDLITNQTILSNFTSEENVDTGSNSQHRAIGLALISGFCFMFLVDQIGEGNLHSQHIPLSSEEPSSSPELASFNYAPKENPLATLGLIIHAAADGIALGAASLSEQEKVSAVIFFAVALHKAPAAFGLSTFLLNLGYQQNAILRQLVYFSFSAPATAILTHLSLEAFHMSASYTLQWMTGWLLLFSGGTFLYVATMHSLPSIKPQGSPSLAFPEIFCIALGMSILLLLPLD